MKISKFSLFLFTLFLVLSLGAHAQSGLLGDFSQSLDSAQIPLSFNFSVNGKDYTFSRSDILGLIEETSDLDQAPNYLSEIENPDLCAYKKSLLCRMVLPYENYGHIKKVYVRSLSEENIQKLLQNLAQKTDTGPTNAKLQVTDGKVSVFALSSPGIQLNLDKSAQALSKYIAQSDFQTTLDLPFKKTDPEVSTNSINNLGVNTLIGEGISDFRGSPKNRVYNIKRSLKQFNGLLIKPGEEFSFIKNLGEVDGEHDYLPELVIKNDKTEPEFGGGICQVSTTAFRAAINSGLEITARQNHVYPVSYYNPQGMDSTVYIPKPDLRFVNNTPGYILIETKIEGTKLIFDFYGTSDGRSVKVIGPRITERGSDGSMKATFTQEVYNKDGDLTRSDVFNSVYASPSKYPHPGAEPVLTEKPKNWSKNEWSKYKTAHGM